MRSLAWVLVSMAACSFDKGGLGGNDAPVVIIDASIDSGFDANTCGTCMGDTLEGCQGQPDTHCDLGCSMANGAHCMQIVPSNGVPITALDGTTAALVTIGAAGLNSKREYTIDTDTGEIDDYGDDGFPDQIPTVVRAAGTGVVSGMGFATIGGVSVLSLDAMHVAGDSTVYGFGTAPLVILSRGDVLIEGDVDFSAGCYVTGVFETTCAGPGGGAGASGAVDATGCGPGGTGGSNHTLGGGGGAMSTNGGAGGDQSPGNKGGVAGNKAACAGATLDPIGGGAGGGAAAAGLGGDGGGGGGALQITSLTAITISHPAAATNATDIYVGGQGGRGAPTTNGGGGGGGAGGAVLLEAPVVAIHAIVSANGGGGGGGRITGPTADGGFGTTTMFQALGGVGDGTGGTTGHGGLGGAAAGNASPGTAAPDGTGGGGGAAGRVRLASKTGASDTSLSTISPAASLGKIVTQ